MNLKLVLSKLVFVVGGVKLNYQLRYFHNRKRFPNLKKPQDWSERVLSSMLSPAFLDYAELVDKIKVRNYVKAKGFDDILLEHYGTWSKPMDIDFAKLPDKFALKTNNGVGNHVFCKNKLNLDKAACLKQLEDNLRIIESQDSILEPQYKSITPLIFCEELIDTGTDSWPIDYKIHCINGEPDHVFLAMERETKVKYGTFDSDWNMLPYTKDAFKPTTYPKKPKYLKQMFDIARVLSKDFEFVRVDLYEHGDRIIFGELTFSPWGGFMYSYTNEAIKLIGSKYE